MGGSQATSLSSRKIGRKRQVSALEGRLPQFLQVGAPGGRRLRDVLGPGYLLWQPRHAFSCCTKPELSESSEAVIYLTGLDLKVKERQIAVYSVLDGGSAGESHSLSLQQTQV